MLQRITSLQNEKLKKLSRLYRRKYREKTKMYIAEGINLVEEALKNDAEFDSVFVREDFLREAEGKALTERLEEKKCDISVLPKALFDHTVNTEYAGGNCGGGKQPDCDVGHFFEGSVEYYRAGPASGSRQSRYDYPDCRCGGVSQNSRNERNC